MISIMYPMFCIMYLEFIIWFRFYFFGILYFQNILFSVICSSSFCIFGIWCINNILYYLLLFLMVYFVFLLYTLYFLYFLNNFKNCIPYSCFFRVCILIMLFLFLICFFSTLLYLLYVLYLLQFPKCAVFYVYDGNNIWFVVIILVYEL